MKATPLMLVIVFALIFGCSSEQKQEPAKDNKQQSTTTSNAASKEAKYSDLTPQLPYQIKEDGLYIYYDGPQIREGNYCYRIVQNNYKYIKVPISKPQGENHIRNMICWFECEDDLGKPSLHQLGYERHKEREIKPEENRLNKNKFKPDKYPEERLCYNVDFNFIEAKEFTKMSRSEFLKNGIVIIGKKISRVVIKSLDNLPKYGSKIVVSYDSVLYDCDSNIIKEFHIQPKVIADFKRIDFKENIFEFIKDETLPPDAAYLSDGQMIRLKEDLVQLIPREPDLTIQTYYLFRPTYYLLEYYNGDKLLDFHAIKLTLNPSPAPNLWDPLKVTSTPPAPSVGFAKNKFALIVAETDNIQNAENFIKSKDPYPLIILPHSERGRVIVGRLFYNENDAQIEKQRLVNMGFKANTIRIQPFD